AILAGEVPGLLVPLDPQAGDVVGDVRWYIAGLDAADFLDYAFDVVDLGLPVVHFGLVVRLHVALDGGDHADHGFFGDLEIAADAGIGALEMGGDGGEILAAEEKAGVLGAAQSFAAAER